MSQLVCFDTHVLIWGIQQNARSSQQTMIPKSKHFIENLSDNNMRAIIPSVVLGEFLMPIPPKEVEKYWNLLNKYLMIASFDAIAAVEFAKIWQSKQKQEIIEQLKQEGMGKNY